jgi:Family of unknown function (DUF5681)
MAEKRGLESNQDGTAELLPRGETHKQYEVGYCRPPKSTQFKKGVSGNCSGRPKKRESSPGQTFKKVFAAPVKANFGGKFRNIEGHEAVFLQLRKMAITGDPQAMRLYHDFYKQFKIDSSLEGNAELRGLFDALMDGPVDTP